MAGRGIQLEVDVGNQRWLSSGAGTHASFSRQASSSSLMVGGNYRVGKKIGSGNFGELRLGMLIASLRLTFYWLDVHIFIVHT